MTPYYALFYEKVPDYIEKRKVFRQEHLQLVTSFYKKGLLHMAGAFEDFDQAALLIFTTETAVQNFVDKDPYVINKVILNYRIIIWNVVT
ncbi:YciI family protein [Aquimarina sp. ERC-38]|uniref:YciI family protein n=1 Tax=Aquimarina sp. ERC-38 TaxID=2949996 RepID=UPI0022486FCA|nr:YciI family protein [Aquimarina sp. ERC-38]UZO80530.1 YciI family protein [Aquimarina sp. ERC-38]